MKWALIFALSGEVSHNIRAMSNVTQNNLHTHQNEYTKGRIKTDREERLSFRSTLDFCINPFDNESHSDGALIIIMTGQIPHPNGNADNALAIEQ